MMREKDILQNRVIELEERLKDIQEEYILAQKITGLGIWHYDFKSDELQWSDGVHLIFGTDKKNFPHTLEEFKPFIHPEDMNKLKKAYEISIIEKKDYFIEHRIVLDDGTIKYVEQRCHNFFDEKGNILYSTGTVLDISERKSLERQILETNKSLIKKVQQRTAEQNILLSLFDKGESILFKWNNDATWSVENVSESITRVLGYKREDFLLNNISYSECIHKDDLENVIREVREAIDTHKEYFEHEAYRVYTKDGDIKWVHDSTIIVRDENDNIISFVGYITDITDIKEKDRQLLQQSRLAQMGEMISMIAHQWRQPLGAIAATSLDLQFDLELDDNIAQHNRTNIIKGLKSIDEFVQNLTTTIDDFRNFYKPNKESIYALMNSPVKKALKIVSATFSADGIEIIEEYNCTNRVNMYENELMQVILNILKNSQDNFREKGIKDPRVTIRTKNIYNGARLMMVDNGGGIDDHIMQKIFDPYFSTKSEKNGTGLGLYMSKTIIETHHKGKLFAKNIDGGVIFYIDIINDDHNIEKKLRDEVELCI